MSPRLYWFAFPLGHFANDWAPAAIWLLAPAMAVSMELSPGELGLLITMHSAGAALAYLPAGILGDHVRRRGRLLAATFWWVAIGYFVAASAGDFWTLALLLAIAGLGDAAWHPLATGVLVQQRPERRAEVLGVHAMGGSLAEVAAPLCVGLLLAWLDWRTVLELCAIPAAVMGLFFLRIAREVPETQNHGMSVTELLNMWRVWRRPQGLRIIWIVTAYNMAFMAVLAMMPLYLQTEQGYDSVETGMLFAMMLLLGSLAQPFIGRLSDIIGRKRVMVTGLSVASVSALALVFVDHSAVLVALFTAVVAILAGIRATILAAMVEAAARRESTTLGLAFTIMDGVGALGALFAGLAGTVELRYAFLFAALITATAVVATLLHVFAPASMDSPQHS